MKVKLIASDLDGTLLNNENGISKETEAALTYILSQGVQFVAATGRNASELPPALSNLPFCYLISANGAYVTKKDTGEAIYTNCLPLEAAVRVMDAGQAHGAYAMFYVGPHVYTSSNFRAYIDTVTETRAYEILSDRYIICDDIRKAAAGREKEVQKVVLFFRDRAHREETLADIARLEDYEMSSSFKGNVEFNRPGVSKADALARILEELGLTPEEIAVIGDGGNDVKMLSMTPNSYAVRNACPQAKAAARHIVGSNCENGVAEMIRLLS